MAEPFTSPYTAPGTDWQTLVDEITLALSERQEAIGQTPYLPVWSEDRTFIVGQECRHADSCWISLKDENIDHEPSANSDWWAPAIVKDVQAVTYWATLQAWLEDNCGHFINHVAGPIAEDGKTFLYFDLSTFRAHADLDPDGFRRATEWDGVNDPDWEYGFMQPGDIIGPWIFEDLQKSFPALRWSIWQGTAVEAYHKTIDIPVPKGTCEAAYVAFEAAWLAEPWTEDEIGRVYASDATEQTEESNGMASHRWKGKPAVEDLPTMCPSAASVYVLPYTHRTFADMDNLGFQNGILKFIEDLDESSEPTRQATDVIGAGIEASPLSRMGYGCPMATYHHSCLIDGSQWLMKWTFTNI